MFFKKNIGVCFLFYGVCVYFFFCLFFCWFFFWGGGGGGFGGCLLLFFWLCFSMFCLKIRFTLTNLVDSGEMSHNAAFHLSLHCL